MPQPCLHTFILSVYNHIYVCIERIDWAVETGHRHSTSVDASFRLVIIYISRGRGVVRLSATFLKSHCTVPHINTEQESHLGLAWSIGGRGGVSKGASTEQV